jgi:hypothetical protein
VCRGSLLVDYPYMGGRSAIMMDKGGRIEFCPEIDDSKWRGAGSEPLANSDRLTPCLAEAVSHQLIASNYSPLVC